MPQRHSPKYPLLSVPGQVIFFTHKSYSTSVSIMATAYTIQSSFKLNSGYEMPLLGFGVSRVLLQTHNLEN
jgi:hypothetical protein